MFWCVVLWFATALGAALQLLSRFEIAAVHRPFFWLPFISYYAHTTFETVSHSFELVLIYFPLGFAVSIAGARRRSTWIAIAATLLIAAPLEYMQSWIVGRYGDVSDVAIAVLGAVIGSWTAGAGWDRWYRAAELHGAPAYDRR